MWGNIGTSTCAIPAQSFTERLRRVRNDGPSDALWRQQSGEVASCSLQRKPAIPGNPYNRHNCYNGLLCLSSVVDDNLKQCRAQWREFASQADGRSLFQGVQAL